MTHIRFIWDGLGNLCMNYMLVDNDEHYLIYKDESEALQYAKEILKEQYNIDFKLQTVEFENKWCEENVGYIYYDENSNTYFQKRVVQIFSISDPTWRIYQLDNIKNTTDNCTINESN